MLYVDLRPLSTVNLSAHTFVAVITETKKRGLIWGLMALPTFHAVSIFMQLYNPLATSQAIALNTPMAPGPPVMPTPDNILEACKATPINAVTAVPVFVEVQSLVYM